MMSLLSEKIELRIFDKNNEAPSVEDIQVLDLTEFTLEFLTLNDSTELVFEPPLILTPELTECKQYMTIENTDLGIDVIAQTREELGEELTAVIAHLWKFCAKEPDEKLGRLLLETKRNLLNAIKAVSDEYS